jgi:hypothetical protein
MSVSPHDRAWAIFTTVASAVCCAPEPPRSAKFNSRRDNSTKIDPGFYGTLDWVFKNHDFRAVMLPHGERLVNLIVFQLEAGEVPDIHYGMRNTDHYQGSPASVDTQNRPVVDT